jgi:choline kinase
MSRYTVPAKKNIIEDNIDVVILGAGAGRRIKSFGSKSLFPVKGTTLINYQIQTIKTAIPSADIVVVLGYEIDKIYKQIPKHVRVVENKDYESTTSTRSAFIGVRACSNDNVLIVNGDIFFNEKIFEICTNESSVLIDKNKMISSGKLGVIVDNGYVSCFNFDIEVKWGQAFSLCGNDIDSFQKICADTKQEVIISEILEMMVNRNIHLKTIEPKGIQLVEIDSYKDLERIK